MNRLEALEMIKKLMPVITLESRHRPETYLLNAIATYIIEGEKKPAEAGQDHHRESA